MAIGTVTAQPNASFSQMLETFKDVSESKHIRFEDGSKGLHTSSKVGGGLMDLLAKANIKFATKNQNSARQEGAKIVKDAVIREFGEEVAEKVFSKKMGLGFGVTVSDMHDISRLAHKFSEEEKKLNEPRFSPMPQIHMDDDNRNPNPEVNINAIRIPGDNLRDVEIDLKHLEDQSELAKNDSTNNAFSKEVDLRLKVMQNKLKELDKNTEHLNALVPQDIQSLIDEIPGNSTETVEVKNDNSDLDFILNYMDSKDEDEKITKEFKHIEQEALNEIKLQNDKIDNKDKKHDFLPLDDSFGKIN